MNRDTNWTHQPWEGEEPQFAHLPWSGVHLSLPEEVVLPVNLDISDGTVSGGCIICGHVNAQRHRIVPGEWGGEYEFDNTAFLCPNHHAAVHLLMRWCLAGKKLKAADEWLRLAECAADVGLCEFWEIEVKPAVLARLAGDHHPAPLKREARS